MGWYEDDEAEAVEASRLAVVSGGTAALLVALLILSVLALIWLGSGAVGFGPPG